MKVTIDLPDQLVKKVKLRAVHDGQKLKDTVEGLLLKGLKVEPPAPLKKVKKGSLEMERTTGLPVFRAAPGTKPPKMTVADTLEWTRGLEEKEELERAGIFAGR